MHERAGFLKRRRSLQKERQKSKTSSLEELHFLPNFFKIHGQVGSEGTAAKDHHNHRHSRTARILHTGFVMPHSCCNLHGVYLPVLLFAGGTRYAGRLQLRWACALPWYSGWLKQPTTGIDLIYKERAEKYHGRIRLDSRPGLLHLARWIWITLAGTKADGWSTPI